MRKWYEVMLKSILMMMNESKVLNNNQCFRRVKKIEKLWNIIICFTLNFFTFQKRGCDLNLNEWILSRDN